MKAIQTMALTAIAMFGLTTAAMAQKKVEASVQADLVSKYMWRGLDRGGVSIQPQAKISWQGLSLRAFGSAGFDRSDAEELNLELGYSRWGFNIGVIDYWRSGVDYEDRYLYYDRDKGPHRLEGNIGYTCKYFSLQAYTTFWGIDDTPYWRSGDYVTDHKRAYSTYIEATVPFRFSGLNWQLSAGMTPFESAGIETTRTISAIQSPTGVESLVNTKEYLYADGPSCVLASLRATKELNLGDVRMPVFAEVHMNPYLQKASLLFGVTVIPF